METPKTKKKKEKIEKKKAEENRWHLHQPTPRSGLVPSFKAPRSRVSRPPVLVPVPRRRVTVWADTSLHRARWEEKYFYCSA